MKNTPDKDIRIKSLEETVQRLLRERSEWENKAYRLENELNASKSIDSKVKEDSDREDIFLKRVGELIRPINHDLRASMVNIGANIHCVIILLKPILEASINNKKNINKIQNYLSTIIREIEYLNKKISDLTYLSGTRPGDFTNVNINNVLQEIIKFVQQRHSSINIELALDNDLPEIQADKASLEQIITNLIINAVEACSPSDGHVTIITQNSADTTSVQIIVKDNGIGIQPSVEDKIYNLHYTTKKTGFGIGLYLVNKAVKLHKGTIICESIPYKGTSFIVTLPISKEEN